MFSVVFDGFRPGSLQGTLAVLQRVSRMVRDRISPDTWRTLGRLKLRNLKAADRPAPEDADGPKPTEAKVTLSDVLEMLEDLLINLTAFSGLVAENITRSQGWKFLDMGRRLERAAHRSASFKAPWRRRGRPRGRCWKRCWRSPKAR